jgi:hypothetical protein
MARLSCEADLDNDMEVAKHRGGVISDLTGPSEPLKQRQRPLQVIVQHVLCHPCNGVARTSSSWHDCIHHI